MKTYLLLQGPNLDMLGMRNPEIYGKLTLSEIEKIMFAEANKLGVELECFQSNFEGELIEKIHSAHKYAGVIYNPAAHTHYSYALRDAVECIDTPFVEVHLSNIYERESFRAFSVFKEVCLDQIVGQGVEGYKKALHILVEYTNGPKVNPKEGCNMEAKSQACSPEEQKALENLKVILEKAAQPINPANRIARVRSVMAEENLDVMFVRNQSDIKWLTAFDGVFDSEAAHCLFITKDEIILHTDSRYSKACARAAENTEITVDGERRSHAAFIVEQINRVFADSEVRLGVEDTLTLAEFHILEEQAGKVLGSIELVEMKPFIINLRAIKDEPEITRHRAAQAITDCAFSHICHFIVPGKTEREIQMELEGYMFKLGAEDLAFSSIVASGPNGADPHAIPGSRKVCEGDSIVIDFGAKVYGYCSDMTRTVFVGQPSEKIQRAWNALYKSQKTAREAVSPELTGAEIDVIANEVLEAEGFGGCMGHSLGHGVGMDVHELPVLAHVNKNKLAPGSVVTVEPGIYIANEFGMRLEDFGVVTSDGFDLFTQSTHEMVIL